MNEDALEVKHSPAIQPDIVVLGDSPPLATFKPKASSDVIVIGNCPPQASKSKLATSQKPMPTMRPCSASSSDVPTILFPRIPTSMNSFTPNRPRMTRPTVLRPLNVLRMDGNRNSFTRHTISSSAKTVDSRKRVAQPDVIWLDDNSTNATPSKKADGETPRKRFKK